MLCRFGHFEVYFIGQSTGMVNVGSKQLELWIGMNGAMMVYSFIAAQTSNQWSGDAKQFFNYLQQTQAFPASSQNLLVYQIGTEAFTGGPTTFTVSQLSASAN